MPGLSTGKLIALGLVILAVLGAIGGAFAYVKHLEHRAERAERSLADARQQLRRCQDNRTTLQAAVIAQSLATASQGVRTATALRDAQDGLARAQERHRDDQARLAAVRRPLTARTPCERADEAAERAREALR